MTTNTRQPLHVDDVRRAFEALPGPSPTGPLRATGEGGEAPPAPPASSRSEELWREARAGVLRLPGWLFAEPAERERLAAILVQEARRAGLTRIDEVVPNASGTGVYAVQARAGDAVHRTVAVDEPEASPALGQRLRARRP